MQGFGQVTADALKKDLESRKNDDFDVRTMQDGDKLIVETMNSTYTFTKCGDEMSVIGTDRFPIDVPIRINGSTWGGSMIRIDIVSIGMHMELNRIGYGGLTTSPVKSWRHIQSSRLDTQPE